MTMQLLLVILDGWGVRKSRRGNALALARTPVFDRLDREASKTILAASGRDVGLPAGFQGNSEVGHLSIGAGRVVDQSMVRIDRMIRNGSFFKNRSLLKAIRNCLRNRSSLHVMGLVQDEGVHAHSRHAVAVLKLAMKAGLERVFLHFFTDGRDTPPRSAKVYVKWLLDQAKKIDPSGDVILPGSMIGRYYAMDRDRRWNRTRKAYDMLVSGIGRPEAGPISAIDHAYGEGQTDEFVGPRVFPDFRGFQRKDSVVFFNFRPDRARQLTRALTDGSFKPFNRTGPCLKGRNRPADVVFVAMTRYYKDLLSPAILENEHVKQDLGECISKHGLTQLRVAETEKYAHVTYFFNSEVERPFKGEHRILIPSPKVATYDLRPEMSAARITKTVLNAVQDKYDVLYDVIIVNFANCDMVGHTGRMPAIIKAVETVDLCVGQLVDAVRSRGGVTVITADHGNCEDKRARTVTSHTVNPVPFYLIFPDGMRVNLRKGRLADVAPTILKLLGLQIPKVMTGRPLIISTQSLFVTVSKPLSPSRRRGS